MRFGAPQPGGLRTLAQGPQAGQQFFQCKRRRAQLSGASGDVDGVQLRPGTQPGSWSTGIEYETAILDEVAAHPVFGFLGRGSRDVSAGQGRQEAAAPFHELRLRGYPARRARGGNLQPASPQRVFKYFHASLQPTDGGGAVAEVGTNEFTEPLVREHSFRQFRVQLFGRQFGPAGLPADSGELNRCSARVRKGAKASPTVLTLAPACPSCDSCVICNPA